jgi:sec-independent protein translocase protein TatB
MFDFSWSEIMVIGAVALVAIGPKDLPKALRTAGTLVRRARGLAREFHNSVDEMIREAELDEVRRSILDTTKLDIDPVPSHRMATPVAPPTPPPPEPNPPEPVAPEPTAPTHPPEP